MTREEKQLLIKDLCERLPYGIKVWYPNGSGVISIVKGIVGDVCYFNEEPRYDNRCPIESVKPYLRPMSSMTRDDYAIVQQLVKKQWGGDTDWLNAHHFDYRGLIEKGLAIEVTEENNPY